MIKAVLVAVGLSLAFLFGFTAHYLYTENHIKEMEIQVEKLNNELKNKTVVEKLVVDHNAISCNG